MRKFLPLLLLLVFSPLVIYAQNSTTQSTTEDIIGLKTRIESDENQIDFLQNQINDMKIRLTEAEKQKNLNEKFNQILEEFTKKEPTEKTWTQGDLLSVSATIVGFFGFASLIGITFRGNAKFAQSILLITIYVAIFFVILSHLFVIYLIVHDGSSSSNFYDLIIIVTMSFTGLILFCMGLIVYLEHRGTEFSFILSEPHLVEAMKKAQEEKNKTEHFPVKEALSNVILLKRKKP